MTEPRTPRFPGLLLRLAGSPGNDKSFAKIIIQILVHQSIQTFHRPSRILNLFVWLFAKMFRQPILWLSRFTEKHADRIPYFLLSSFARSVISQSNFETGAKLLDENKPEEAWTYLKRCIQYSKEPHHFFIAGICQLVGLGHFDRAMAIFSRNNALRAAEARSLGLETNFVRFLDPIWVGAFGHLAQLDYLLKLNILEGRDPKDTILYIPSTTSVANRCLLNHWRPFLNVVENEAELPLPLKKLKTLTFDYLSPQLTDGTTVYMWELAGKTYRRWFKEDRGPLLSLPPALAKDGREALAGVGIPRDAWFVTLHIRERSSKPHHAELHDVLNAPTEDYIPAIQEITKRGGWVIRMGDPTMSRLPKMPRVFEYCHSEIRSDWMDIFLCASARFFLGTSSGPSYVPLTFGVPSVLTNWWPPLQRPLPPHDTFIPKLYRRISDNRFLSLSASLREPFGICNSVEHLAKSDGVVVENNSPEEIRMVTIEMLDRMNGAFHYDEGEADAQERANRIYETANVLGLARIGRSFLKTHGAFAD